MNAQNRQNRQNTQRTGSLKRTRAALLALSTVLPILLPATPSYGRCWTAKSTNPAENCSPSKKNTAAQPNTAPAESASSPEPPHPYPWAAAQKYSNCITAAQSPSAPALKTTRGKNTARLTTPPFSQKSEKAQESAAAAAPLPTPTA